MPGPYDIGFGFNDAAMGEPLMPRSRPLHLQQESVRGSRGWPEPPPGPNMARDIPVPPGKDAFSGIPLTDPKYDFLLGDEGTGDSPFADAGIFNMGTGPSSGEELLDELLTPPTQAESQLPGELYQAGIMADDDARMRQLGLKDDRMTPFSDHPSGAAILEATGPQAVDPFGYMDNALRAGLVAEGTAPNEMTPWEKNPTKGARIMPDYGNEVGGMEWAQDVNPEFMLAMGFGPQTGGMRGVESKQPTDRLAPPVQGTDAVQAPVPVGPSMLRMLYPSPDERGAIDPAVAEAMMPAEGTAQNPIDLDMEEVAMRRPR